jgi:hypothetical protein
MAYEIKDKRTITQPSVAFRERGTVFIVHRDGEPFDFEFFMPLTKDGKEQTEKEALDHLNSL